MNKVLRVLNVLRKRKSGIAIGLMVGAMVFLAIPMSFSYLYSNLMAWESAHLHGLFQVVVNVMTFAAIILLAIAVLTAVRATITQLFRCRWYKTR